MVVKKETLLVIIILSIVSIILFFISPAISSQRLINFQGYLTNQAGELYSDGTYTIIFSLYDTPAGGTPLWIERHESVSVSKGLVNVLMGSITSFDEPSQGAGRIEFGTPKYLGIAIDADNNPQILDPEMLPRQQIVPAIHAYNADKLEGKAVSEFTTPETDTGRMGVAGSLYEGNTKLEDKYLEKAVGGDIKGGLNIAGNVGIGMTEPQQKLHIRTSGANALQYSLQLHNPDRTDSGGTATGILFATEAGTFGKGAIVYERKNSYARGSFHFLQNTVGNNTNVALGQEVMTIQNNGNVGIGTTGPSQKLDVNGDIRVRNKASCGKLYTDSSGNVLCGNEGIT